MEPGRPDRVHRPIRLGPIESFEPFQCAREIGWRWMAWTVTHVSFELLRQVSLPAGVCD